MSVEKNILNTMNVNEVIVSLADHNEELRRELSRDYLLQLVSNLISIRSQLDSNLKMPETMLFL